MEAAFVPLALLIATGASIKPIRMIIGPVTKGGRILCKVRTLINLKIMATKMYNKPAIAIPPNASGSDPPLAVDTAIIPGIKAKEEPKTQVLGIL